MSIQSTKHHQNSTGKMVAIALVGIMLFSCLAPKFNVVELKAKLISADIFTRQPFLRHYFDLVELAENIVKSFYCAQSIVSGATKGSPRKSLPLPQKNSSDEAGQHANVSAASLSRARIQQNSQLRRVMRLKSMFGRLQSLGSSADSITGGLFKAGTCVGGLENMENYLVLISLFVLFMPVVILARGKIDDAAIISIAANSGAGKKPNLGTINPDWVFCFYMY